MTPIEIGGNYAGARDFGIVEALPTKNLAVGVLCTFKVATGVYWRLQYTGEATYPWAVIGGQPFKGVEGEIVEGASTAYVNTGMPAAFVAPLAMEFAATFGPQVFRQPTATGLTMYCGLHVGGLLESLVEATTTASGQFVPGVTRNSFKNLAVAKGQSIDLRYKVSASKGSLLGVVFEIQPIRVG